MPKRQTAYLVGFSLLTAWGLFEVALALSDHGLTFSRDLGTGLAWTLLGITQLIWGGRNFSADDRTN